MLTIKKEFDVYPTVTFRDYKLRWTDTAGFYAVAIGWHSIQTSEGFDNTTTVYLTPMEGEVQFIRVATLADAFKLVRALGVMV